jgi:glycosyltransferase involved in cell wall biosynthesis
MKGRPSNHFDRLGVPVKMLRRHRTVEANDVPDADVIVATWWETAAWLGNFPNSKGRKVHFVQDYEIWNGQKTEVDAALNMPYPKITISNWLASILEDLGLPSPEVIHNGLDRTLFSVPRRERPHRPTVGFVHTNNPRKGADIAIAAIQIAQKAHPDLAVKVFGHSPPQSPINLRNMTFIVSPAQEELSAIYGSCTAWLFPSREEGFGLPILEAIACGTPVIACPSGAAPEILKNGGGALLKTFEPEEMAAAIIKYINVTDAEWRKNSDEAIEISDNYQWPQCINRFESALKKLPSTV